MKGAEPDGPEPRLLQAQAYLDAGRGIDACQLAGQILAEQPDHPSALLLLANAQLSVGRATEAVRTAKDALAVTPEYEQAWRVLALALTEVGALPGAIAAAERAISLEPEEWRGHLVACIVLRRSGEWANVRRALDEAETAARLAPEEPSVHVERGNVLAALGDRERASEAYRLVLGLDPTNPAARSNLALMRSSDRKFLDAADTYASLLRESPDDAAARRNFVRAVGNFVSLAAFLGILALTVSLWFAFGWSSKESENQAAAVAVLVAALIVIGVKGARLLRGRRVHVRTLWREHTMAAVSLTLTFVSLAATLVTYLARLPEGVVPSVVPMVILANLSVFILARVQIASRSAAQQAPPRDLEHLDPETARERVLFTLDRDIDLRSRRLAFYTVVFGVALVLLGIVAEWAMDPPNPARTVIGWTAVAGLAVTTVTATAVILRVRSELRALRQSRDEYAAQP